MKTKLLTAITICIALFSCSDGDSKEKKEQEIKQSKIEIQKKNCFAHIHDKYDISYTIDTVKYFYSDDFVPVIRSKYQLIEKFGINDIYKVNDSIYSIFIETIDFAAPNKYYLDLYINEEGKNYIRNRRGKPIFVVSLENIQKINFKLNVFDSADNDGHCNSYIEINGFDFSPYDVPFKGRGQIVDAFYIEDFSDTSSGGLY